MSDIFRSKLPNGRDKMCYYIKVNSLIHLTLIELTLSVCSFWDPVFLPELCSDRVARNLLYIEALAAVSDGHWEIMDDVRKELNALQKKALKKEVSSTPRVIRFVSMGQCDICPLWCAVFGAGGDFASVRVCTAGWPDY